MIAILSPHLDDAVLSCWSVLAGHEDVVVLNVFTGAPPAGSGARWWDRMTGSADSEERMRERLEEDRAALALAGREAVGLGLLDAQYRDQNETPGLVVAISSALPSGCTILAPAGIGDHADHVLVRNAALAIRRGGVSVTLYADLPHAIGHGWPTWVAGAAGIEEADLEWERTIHTAGLNAAGTGARVCRLDRDTLAGKIEALRSYATQVPALDAMAFRPLLNPGTLPYEVFWAL